METRSRKIGRFFSRLLFPHAVNCLCCDECRQVSERDSLCDACREKIKNLRIPAEACDRCLMPLRKGKRCAFCASPEMAHISRVYAPYRYADEVRSVIHAFKFVQNDEALPAITEGMLNALPTRDFDCIVPVPMHRLRLREKGVNHTRILADALSQKTGIPVYTPLERIRYHKPQSRSRITDRRKNVENAFQCRGDVNGLKILLLDDVRTTGSTSSVCAKALMNGGAGSVSLWVFAVVYRYIK